MKEMSAAPASRSRAPGSSSGVRAQRDVLRGRVDPDRALEAHPAELQMARRMCSVAVKPACPPRARTQHPQRGSVASTGSVRVRIAAAAARDLTGLPPTPASDRYGVGRAGRRSPTVTGPARRRRRRWPASASDWRAAFAVGEASRSGSACERRRRWVGVGAGRRRGAAHLVRARVARRRPAVELAVDVRGRGRSPAGSGRPRDLRSGGNRARSSWRAFAVRQGRAPLRLTSVEPHLRLCHTLREGDAAQRAAVVGQHRRRCRARRSS